MATFQDPSRWVAALSLFQASALSVATRLWQLGWFSFTGELLKECFMTVEYCRLLATDRSEGADPLLVVQLDAVNRRLDVLISNARTKLRDGEDEDGPNGKAVGGLGHLAVRLYEAVMPRKPEPQPAMPPPAVPQPPSKRKKGGKACPPRQPGSRRSA